MKLYELRKSIHLSQSEIAKILKIPQTTYSSYETKRANPDISTLIKLADLFHISVDELIEHNYTNLIDKGLMNDTELNIIKVMKELNKINQNRLESYAMALFQTQIDEDNITKKVKGE